VGVWKTVFQVDGTTKATITASPYTYAWPSSSVANGTHTLAVTVYDLAGNTTSTSEPVTVTNGAATTPTAPTLTTATPANTSIALTSNPSSDGGSPITNYKIYRSTTPGTETLLTTLTNTTTWTDTNLTNGTTYYYKITAINNVGEGLASNE